MIPKRILDKLKTLHNYSDVKKEYHPEPSVANHLFQATTLALEASDNWDVCYATLLHDIAKDTHDRKAWAQHPYRGAVLVCDDVTPKIRWLVENHMKPYDFQTGQMKVFKRQELEEHEWFDDLMRLHNYDSNGRNADGKHAPEADIFSAI
ncbi:MAG: HD domain-containing protein, partial [Nitrososphaera sp.]|nr:HD domain-containing protein [Nitrososphaera sp.]